MFCIEEKTMAQIQIKELESASFYDLGDLAAKQVNTNNMDNSALNKLLKYESNTSYRPRVNLGLFKYKSLFAEIIYTELSNKILLIFDTKKMPKNIHKININKKLQFRIIKRHY